MSGRWRAAKWFPTAAVVLLSVNACATEDESAVASVAAATGLDFDVYLTDVEPIFTRRR
jgi:hypothetical protein